MLSHAARTIVGLVLLFALLGLVACSDDGAAATPDDVVVVDIVIADGAVTPTGRQVDVTVGQDVRLQVDSDAPDELHVHSAPEEQEFEVAAAAGQTFEFTTEQPGQFDIELHESGTLVAQLVVQP